MDMARFWGFYFSCMLVYFVIMMTYKIGIDRQIGRGGMKLTKLSFGTMLILLFWLWIDVTIPLNAKIIDSLIASFAIAAGIIYFYLCRKSRQHQVK
jgi:hypothetical protein